MRPVGPLEEEVESRFRTLGTTGLRRAERPVEKAGRHSRRQAMLNTGMTALGAGWGPPVGWAPQPEGEGAFWGRSWEPGTRRPPTAMRSAGRAGADP